MMTRIAAVPALKEVNPRMEPVPGGARWCEEHGRHECMKNRKHGMGECHAPAIKGTNACRIHSGLKSSVAKARGQAAISAWSAIGGTPNIDYRMAVLGVLQMTWLRLGAYSELLRKQVVAEGNETEPITIDQDGLPQTSGLIGHKYGAAGKEGIIYAQSEEVRALVALESAERERVVKFAKTAHDMGISERLTSLAERWGDVVAGRITALLDDPRLQLTPEQAVVIPELISTHLGSIDVEAMEVKSTNGNGSARGVRSGGGRSGDSG